MNNPKRRLKEKRGETLIESMAAILIFTLASLLLLSLFATAGKINHTAAEWTQKQAAQIELAEKAEEAFGCGTVTISIHGERESVEVEFFGREDGVYAYYPAREGLPE